jgi:acetyl esterase/lipase
MALTASTAELEDRDVLLSPDFIRLAGEMYAGTLDVDHPWVSPVDGDLGSLPPIRVYAGEYEILLPSICAFVDLASAAGTNTHLVIGESQ